MRPRRNESTISGGGTIRIMPLVPTFRALEPMSLSETHGLHNHILLVLSDLGVPYFKTVLSADSIKPGHVTLSFCWFCTTERIIEQSQLGQSARTLRNRCFRFSIIGGENCNDSAWLKLVEETGTRRPLPLLTKFGRGV